jgi:hypothetical protein
MVEVIDAKKTDVPHLLYTAKRGQANQIGVKSMVEVIDARWNVVCRFWKNHMHNISIQTMDEPCVLMLHIIWSWWKRIGQDDLH